MTRTAAEMLEPIPANALFGIRVRSAGPDGAEVWLTVAEQASNVIGSLHSSGLVALLDAAGLAAVIGAAEHPGQLSGVVPLGSRAEARFRPPGRGMLAAHCALPFGAQQELMPFWERATGRAQVRTPVVIHDQEGTLVCDGAFTWSLRRREG